MTAEKFVERMKKIQKKTKVALEKVQKEMKKYVDRKQKERKKYKVGNSILLSIKDLKCKMVKRRLEKLIE